MSYVAVIVGVSLLRNALSRGVTGEFRDVIDRALGGDASADSMLGRLGLGSELYKRLLDFVCSDVNCCAELSSLAELRRVVTGQMLVELFHTSTRANWLCTMLIANCLSHGRVLDGVTLQGSDQVSLFDSNDVEGGLASFVSVVGRRLFEAASRGLDTYVIVTGGTKIEVILASMIAWLLNAKPVYKVEGGPLIILPQLPITISPEVARYICSTNKPIPSNIAHELSRLGLLTRDGRVSKWFLELLRVRGLC